MNKALRKLKALLNGTNKEILMFLPSSVGDVGDQFDIHDASRRLNGMLRLGLVGVIRDGREKLYYRRDNEIERIKDLAEKI